MRSRHGSGQPACCACPIASCSRWDTLNWMTQQPRQALRAFDRSASLRSQSARADDNSFLANLARGRARAWSELGDVQRAISFQEETVRLAAR